jgi:hypothetical protein
MNKPEIQVETKPSTKPREFSIYKKQEEELITFNIEKFFKDYYEFYSEIPILGDSHSHQALFLASSRVYKDTSTDEIIEPLLEEITTLREEVLALNIELVKQ